MIDGKFDPAPQWPFTGSPVGAVELADAVAGLEAAWAGSQPASDQEAMLIKVIDAHSKVVNAIQALPGLSPP